MGYTKTVYRRLLQAHDNSTGAHKYLRVVDEKEAGVDGGASSAATWNVRALTDISDNIGVGALLESNKILLPAGIYSCLITAPAYGAVGIHRVALFDVTSSPEVKLLVGGASSGVANVVQQSSVRGSFELAVETEVEIRHYTQLAVASSGLGLSANVDGDSELYTIAEFWMQVDPRADDMV